MTSLHDRVVPTKPDGYHLVGVVIGLPDVFDRQFYSINFDCADGTIENLWLTENEFVPFDTCRNCGGAHHIQACGEILAALLAPFRPDEKPEQRLRASLDAAALALACNDCRAQGLVRCAMCAVWAGENKEEAFWSTYGDDQESEPECDTGDGEEGCDDYAEALWESEHGTYNGHVPGAFEGARG